jgi:hypothetical protein
MAKKYRTGPGNIGRDLEPEEVDANFRDSDAREQEALDAVALRELLANKAVDFSVINDTKYPSVKAVSDFVGAALAGVVNLRGAYDASPNVFPSTGGSGVGGAVRKGDMWFVSVNGTLGGQAVTVGDAFFANVNTPGQTAGNWSIVQVNIVFVPENVSNKSTTTASPDNVKYPTLLLMVNELAKKKELVQAIDTVNTSYTVVANDSDRLKRITSASAVNLTLPNDANEPNIQIGFAVDFSQAGAGQVTFLGESGVTINSANNFFKTRTQHSVVTARKVAANTWLLIGDMSL